MDADFALINERFLGDKSDIQKTRALYDAWIATVDEEIQLLLDDSRARQLGHLDDELIGQLSNLNTQLQGFIEFASSKADEFLSGAIALKERTLTLTYGIIALVVVGSLLMAIFTSRGITRPINKVVDIANHLAEGDLSVHIQSDRKDETGQLMQAMRRMVSFGHHATSW